MLKSSEKLNILIAYPYFTNNIMDLIVKYKDKINLLVDSGAFTAHSKGKIITLDEYCNFLDNLPVKPWHYFMLDVIGNSELTMKQYEEMLYRGYRPIPIFTQGEKFETLDKFYETSDLVGVGSLVGTKGNKKYLQYLMKQAADRKIHWLGFTALNFIKKYRPYCCDSSSFTMAMRFGTMHVYLGKGRPILNLKRKDFIDKPNPEILKRIEQFGYNSKDCSKSIHWKNRGTVSKISVASWVALSIEVKKVLGTNLFLAVSNDLNFKDVMKEFNYQTTHKVT